MFSNGRANVRRNNNKLRLKKMESLSKSGEALSLYGVERIIPHLRAIRKKIESGKAGKNFASLNPLTVIAPQTVAAITMRTIVDLMQGSPSLHTVSQAIGEMLWIEAMLNRLTKEETKRYEQGRRIKRHRIKNLRGMESTEDWTTKDKMACGNLLVELVVKETGLIRIIRSDEPNKKRRIVEPTEQCVEWIMQVQEQHELLSPHYLPTIINPKKFNKDLVGGYHKYPYELFKTNNNLIASQCKGDEPFLHAANVQGDVAYRVRNWQLKQIEYAQALHLTIPESGGGGLLPISGWTPTPYPKHLPDDHPDVLKWKIAAKAVHVKNDKTRSSRIGVAILLHIADRFKDEPEIWFPMSLDFRGRLYYKPPYLNPQGSDLARSLLEFSYFTYIQTEEQANWLRIHGANVYGLGKSDWQTRIDWVMEHEQLILQAGNSPWISSEFWIRAEKPWSFLSFCHTYYEWKTQGPTYQCRHPVILDCSASGIQHFSGLLRSEEMGSLVNLHHTDKPQDIYTTVMNKVNARLRSSDELHARKWLALQPDRTLAKLPVMCIPYAATYCSFYQFAYDWGAKRATTLYGNKNWLGKKGAMKTVHYMAKILYEEASDVIRPAVTAMNWFKSIGVKAGKKNTPLTWTTPAGVLVKQQYNSTKDTRIRLKYLSDIHLDIRVQEDCRTLNTVKMGNGLTSNILHSFDSSLMCLCTLKAREKNVINIGGIHDAFITDPSSMSTLRDAARESFAEIYKNDWLTKTKDTLRKQIPYSEQVDLPVEPQLGELDPTLTLKSNYFIT